MSIKVLITGADGQLGRCLQDRMPKDWQIMALNSASLDICNADEVDQIINAFQPTLILNAAAYTLVDKAQTQIQICEAVNIKGAHNLAIAAARTAAKFIHISTDYVFDGTSNIPYTESMATNPQSVYGASKLAGEVAVLEANPHSIIIRTAWVFSEYGNNFVKTMLELGKTKTHLGIVADQFGCPTYAGDLAQAMIDLTFKDAVGIYHFCGDNAVSWYDFAATIFKIAQTEYDYPYFPNLKPLTTAEYPTAAKRPAYSVLNCQRINGLIIQCSRWDTALHTVIQKHLS